MEARKKGEKGRAHRSMPSENNIILPGGVDLAKRVGDCRDASTDMKWIFFFTGKYHWLTVTLTKAFPARIPQLRRVFSLTFGHRTSLMTLVLCITGHMGCLELKAVAEEVA